MQAVLVSLVLALCVLSIGRADAFGDTLSDASKRAIGKQIWKNECGGTVSGLTSWNAGEEFPSLGIGHFIWYPRGFRGPFDESWPRFVEFAVSRGSSPPRVALAPHSPWVSRADFQRDFHGSSMTSLRDWLAANVVLQTDFIIARSRKALPRVLAAAPRSERKRIETNYRKVAKSPQGTYALIDYVNFKGEGVLSTERYQGRGWGLLQVLGEMREVPAGGAAAVEFAAAAKRVLSRRIANAPSSRGEKRWEKGWHNRCDTYARPL